MKEQGVKVEYLVGTMIEVPRGALTADEIAERGRVLLLRHQRPDADDLRLLARRRRQVPARLLRNARSSTRIRSRPRRGRRRPAGRDGRREGPARPARDLKIGICGEHGGDPASVHFFHAVGLDYVERLALPHPGGPAGGGASGVQRQSGGLGAGARACRRYAGRLSRRWQRHAVTLSLFLASPSPQPPEPSPYDPLPGAP